jgi:hypothetical protein
MTHFHDPERAAEVRRALSRLLDLIAREVTRDLPGATGETLASVVIDEEPSLAADVSGFTIPKPMAPLRRPRPGGLQ